MRCRGEKMNNMIQQRFPVKFDKWYKILSSALFLFPSSSYVDVDGEEVRVQMEWAFRSCFAKAAIVSAAETHEKKFSRGVHGFAGRWLVNGSGQGILTISDIKSTRLCHGISRSLRTTHAKCRKPSSFDSGTYKGILIRINS